MVEHTRLTAARAVALAADELAEASSALHEVERALLTDAAPRDREAFPKDLQQLDLLSQSIEELRRYLHLLSGAMENDASLIDLDVALSVVRLGRMRARLAGHEGEPGEAIGSIDLF